MAKRAKRAKTKTPVQLDAYRAKRDPAKTPEPSGERAARGGNDNRFVVHEHHARRLHWDLRLEHDGVLLSFALPRGVPEDPSENRLAVHTEDHPIEYLDFHGTIPKGEYDVPLIVSDTMFSNDGKILFSSIENKGFYGDVITVNGTPWPVMKVERPAVQLCSA